MATVIAGRKPVIEALRAGRPVEKVLLQAGATGAVIEEIRALAARRSVPTATVGREEFRGVFSGETAQGVLAIVQARELLDLGALLEVPARRGERGLLLMLDEIADPHNLGALIRSAECAGIHGVLLPRHRTAPLSASVVKSSAGATEHMAVAEVTNLVAAIGELKQKGYWIIGLAVEGNRSYTQVDYRDPVVIVVGNEGKGIRRLVREHCDHLVTIPLYGSIGSLNASVAGALVMYEAARQRHPS